MLDLDRVRLQLRDGAAGPLHHRLRSAIRAQVLDGTLQPGMPLEAERSLQKQLGLSRSTIRQAIKSLVGEGMLESIVGAGTFVRERPRRSRDRDLVGVIVPNADYFLYFADLVSSLGFRLREAGLRLDISLHNERLETLNSIAGGLLDQDVVGVVMTPTASPNIERVIAQLRARGVVVVLVARYLDSISDLDYVGVDNERIGYESTRHLLELGHTGIVHLAGTSTSTVRDRARGYVRAMSEVGLSPRMCVPPVESGFSSPEMLRYLLGDRDPALLWTQVGRRELTGAFCFNDALASWVQREIRMLNLSIPRDLSVIGVDNMPYADFFDAPLTTFALPGEDLAREAANVLLRRLNGESFPRQRILLPAQFMLRRSTAPPPPKPMVPVPAAAASLS